MAAASVGTVSYCAPELLKEGKLTKAADVYSFAMLMWEIYSGSALFRGMSIPQASITSPATGTCKGSDRPTTGMLFSGKCNASQGI